MPHHGKRYFLNPWNRVSEERKQNFTELKQELDPQNAFTNEFMQKYFSGVENLDPAVPIQLK
jgi:hypothetical protein